MYTAMSDFYRELFILQDVLFSFQRLILKENQGGSYVVWEISYFCWMLRLRLLLLNCPHQIHTAKNCSVECLHE